jgi:CHAT domain-containing protein
MVAFCLLSCTCAAQSAEQTSIRLLAEKLRGAYAARDLDAVLSLWSDQSPQKAAQREATQKLFRDAAITAVHQTTTGDPEIAGDRARLRVDRETAGGTAGPTKLVLEWVRDQSEWKIVKESSATDDLAARIAALSRAEKPDSLLAANPDLVDAGLARALIDRATPARNQGNLPGALAMLSLAATIAESKGTGAVRALALNNTGLVYADQGDYAAALDCYRRSLEISETLHDDAGASRALGNLSAVYSGMGDLALAKESLEKSLAIGHRLRDHKLITTALGNMAINEARRGDYLRSLSLFQQAQELLQPGTDARGLAGNLNNIGNVYLWQGDLVQSYDYFHRELDLATSAGIKPLIGVAWMGIGRVLQFRGDLRGAVASFEKSLAVFNETGSKPYAASDLTFLGSAYSLLGEHQKAVEYFQKGLDLQKAMGAMSEVALSLGRIAEVYNRKGDYRAALQSAEEARKNAVASDLREAEWLAELQAGRAQQGLNENAAAETHFRRAVATIEDLRRNVAGAESERANYFESKLEPYHRLVGILVATGRAPEAFEYAERAKARVLLDVLHNGRADLTSAMSPEELRQDQSQRVHLASLNMQLAMARRSSSAPQISQASQALNRARLEYEAFQNQMYTRYPLWKIESGVQPVGAGQLHTMLPGAESAFLEFVVAEDKVYLFTSGGGSHELKAVTVPIARDALAEQVSKLQGQMAARNLGYRASAVALYKLLIAPAGIDLAHTRQLVVVPDGVLWELPFQALVGPEGRYLLDACAVSYAPSMTVLKTMIEVKRQRIDTPAPTRLLAMGNPEMQPGMQKQVTALYRDGSLENLPLARTEVESLGRIYGGNSHVYTGGDALESRFKAEAGDARVLHLATHAVVNNASPMYSYLVLAGEPASGDDGLLEARELLTMKLHAELAVLSACETARGRVGAGEGVIGLSWALLVSGVPSTVLSQWKVASESTTRFMTAFHQNRKKMNDAEALREAALSLRKNPAYQHPFYWAPFTLIGAASGFSSASN